MENNETLGDNFRKELEAASANTILDPAYRRKKLILWYIRTGISIFLYAIFWEHEWVRLTLVVVVPLSLFSLFTIIGAPYLLKRKIARTRSKIESAEKIMQETPNDQDQHYPPTY